MSGKRAVGVTPPWSESAVREALGLELPRARSPATFSGISTDSRSISPDALFVALAG